MSRICVKNLPKYAAEDRLREVFSQKGEITDVKLMRTKDGKSRQFGFIGFRTAEKAQEAIAYFNKSFLDTCRISCEIAPKVGDPDIPRPWSRHSLKNKEKAVPNKDTSTVVVSKVEKKSTKKNVDDNDPKHEEFLQVMQPRAKTKLLANDTLVAAKQNKGSTHEDRRILKELKDLQKDPPTSCSAGLKRRRTPEKFQGLKNLKKSAEQRVIERISPEVGGDSHMGEEEDVLDNMVVHKEPSVYDNLLMRLGSDNKVLSDAYKRRLRREEGESDTEEEEDGPDSFDNTNHDYLNEGFGDESAGEAGTPEEINRIDNDSAESVETYAEDDGRESPDSEEEYKMEASSSVTGHSVSPSSFSSHLGHTLSNEEINEVLEKRRKYNWEVSTADMPNCKWIGTGECLKIPDENSRFESNLKPALFKHWLSTYKESGGHEFHASKERMFFSLFNSYRDVLNCNKKPFYLKGQREDSSSMDAYIMHSLNHIFKTGDLVTKNDSKLSKNQESTKEDMLHNDEKFLDQGFARAKVLILLPLRSIAHRVVMKLIQLTPSSHRVNVEHMARFLDDFGGGVDDDEDPDKVNGPGQMSSKPSDFTALFNGNTDDHFMIGIKFTRKSIKLYNDFYKSDMIVASPLGLITKIGEAEREKEKNVDYLSSIEVLIIDYADVIAMQNWAHVKTVVEQLNRLPSKQLGTDVMRVRQWYLDGNARFYRQSIVLGHYLNPDMNALFNHNFVNYEGKVKLVCEYKGTLSKVLLQVRQVCERFAADSIESADDARLHYFSEKVFPKIKDSIQGGIMLFISSYFEFVRLRSFLKSQNSSFCLLGEYTKQSDISRSRLWFFEGTRKILLYTERAHFYHRYKIRGIKNLIIYSLPERKEFYPEIVNLLEGSQEMTCSVLFSRFDQLRLERIVGSASAKRMVSSDKSVFVFC